MEKFNNIGPGDKLLLTTPIEAHGLFGQKIKATLSMEIVFIEENGTLGMVVSDPVVK